MYKLKYSKQAIRSLRKMPRNLKIKILERLDNLKKDPYKLTQVKPIIGQKGTYRLRISDWRIVYTVKEDTVEILILKIAPRGEIYKI